MKGTQGAGESLFHLPQLEGSSKNDFAKHMALEELDVLNIRLKNNPKRSKDFEDIDLEAHRASPDKLIG